MLTPKTQRTMLNQNKTNIFFTNVKRAFTNVFDQFDGSEPLINDDAKAIINDAEALRTLRDKVLSAESSTEVELKGIKFFIEA